uniref:Uncharacterized protein n=1 Tax=Romanomermis culicivorax TaxID=13658 RepID=A0A915JAC9_ROMCU
VKKSHKRKNLHTGANLKLLDGEKLKFLETGILDLNSKMNALLFNFDRQNQSINRFSADL